MNRVLVFSMALASVICQASMTTFLVAVSANDSLYTTVTGGLVDLSTSVG